MGKSSILYYPKSRDWMFAATVDSHKRKMLRLFLERDTPIRRHVKIRMGANPHDPVWRLYFKARKERLMKSTPKCFRVPTEGALVEA
jgi:RNA-directed DNA polymerase